MNAYMVETHRVVADVAAKAIAEVEEEFDAKEAAAAEAEASGVGVGEEQDEIWLPLKKEK